MHRISLVLFFAFLAFPLASIVTESTQAQSAQPINVVNGYPQFQLHGQPFFAHSTAFFYNRIPRDEWARSLVKLKEMGINTVDLYIAWNWHEPEEGKLDFDGPSNPRRDVKALLAMTAEMGFAVIVRPGPVILNEWRNGGYPDWLLARPEFAMHEVARRDGHYPPLSGLSASNSEEASKQWMANDAHMRYTRRWFADVMREVLKGRQATEGGNVIAIQLDDDQAINRANYNGPIFWQYMNSLTRFLREAGATIPVYINPTDMRVSAAGTPHEIGAMGQWYFNFGTDAALRWEDTATLQFYTETLKTQPHFPPMVIEYQAGWYGTGEDSYAKTADPTNTLLSSRVMIGHGLHGLNYFPVQDTLYPAGWEVPWTNHYYTWESALNLAREERPRAAAVHRNGRLIAGLGRELATSHKAADLGLVYPISSFERLALANLTREDVLKVSRTQMQIQQFCQLNQMSVEYLDLEFQPLDLLKRHKAIVLPVFDDEALKKTAATGREEITAANEERRGDGVTGRRGEKKLELSVDAQRKLVEFVKGGGVLVCTPSLPTELNELKAEPLASRVIVVPDFWRTVPTEPGKTNRDQLLASVQSATVEFVSRLSRLGVNRRVKARVVKEGERSIAAASAGASVEPDLVATQLVADNPKQTYGFVSLVNFDDKRAMRVTLNVADPASTGRLELPEFNLRARDALMLPLRLPLGSGGEELLFATAELTRRELANGKISMRFYAPDAAEAVLNLPHAPAGAVTIDGLPAVASYDATNKRLTIKLVEARRTARSDDEDELARRRQHELDVEIVYERGLPELAVKTAKLIIGETNQVAVEITNRTAAAAVRGKLKLSVDRLFRHEEFLLDVNLPPQTTRSFNFAVPLSKQAVADDQVTLQATLTTNTRQFNSPTATAEILPRFSWQVFPKVTMPLRADTALTINPPLLLPTDANATAAQFSLRVGNNTSQPITLKRESLFLNAPPLKLAPDEEMQSTFTFNYTPGEKSALNQFNITLSDGVLTETVRVAPLTLRKGEAVAFAYDVDRDGFDDYVMENEFLRLVISPNAGARAFTLLNKRTGQNVFTSIGGLRDKFVELDPSDPTRNPKRKRGAYGTFNRAYSAEVVSGMGAQSVLKLSYDAPDVFPSGARIERTIALKAGEEFFTVDYRVTPKASDGKQAFWSASSIVVGDPANQARKFLASEGAFEFAAMKTREVKGGWLAAPLDGQTTFGVFWREAEVQTAEVEMKDFSSLVNLKFKPFASATEHSYRLAFYFGALPPERLQAERMRLLGQ
ncbi:MAG: beta-galactosidase [Acidobacteriota bacterium]|nr:beta-galactosidase [Acidobacteriota bacterium]